MEAQNLADDSLWKKKSFHIIISWCVLCFSSSIKYWHFQWAVYIGELRFVLLWYAGKQEFFFWSEGKQEFVLVNSWWSNIMWRMWRLSPCKFYRAFGLLHHLPEVTYTGQIHPELQFVHFPDLINNIYLYKCQLCCRCGDILVLCDQSIETINCKSSECRRFHPPKR